MLNEFIELSKKKKLQFSRIFFESIYSISFKSFTLHDNLFYKVYIFSNKIFNYDSLISTDHLIQSILSHLYNINQISLQNIELFSKEIIDIFKIYLNNIILKQDYSENIETLFNYNKIESNLNNYSIKNISFELLNKQLIIDLINTTNIFTFETYDKKMIDYKLKDNCCICLNKSSNPILTTCCKQLLCLKCSLLCLQQKFKCPLCRRIINNINKFNIINNYKNYNKKKNIESIQDIMKQSHNYNKNYLLDKILNFITNTNKWNFKIIIILNDNPKLDLKYEYIHNTPYNEIKDILKKYKLNVYNIFKNNVSTINANIKEFNSLGGVLIVPSLVTFKNMNMNIYTDYIIFYSSYEPFYNKHRIIYDFYKPTFSNPLNFLKFNLSNEKTVFFDLVL